LIDSPQHSNSSAKCADDRDNVRKGDVHEC
jgi:hypothetical protein